jgi:hypothetical protein
MGQPEEEHISATEKTTLPPVKTPHKQGIFLRLLSEEDTYLKCVLAFLVGWGLILFTVDYKNWKFYCALFSLFLSFSFSIYLTRQFHKDKYQKIFYLLVCVFLRTSS